jgi:hypothetical protein
MRKGPKRCRKLIPVLWSFSLLKIFSHTHMEKKDENLLEIRTGNEDWK